MKHNWIGVALLASTWLIGLEYYHQVQWWPLWVPSWAQIGSAGHILPLALVVLGSLFMIGAVRRRLTLPVACIGLLLLLPAMILAPWPHQVGPIVLGIGLAIQILTFSWRPLAWLSSAAVTSGLVLLTQSLVMAGYKGFTARWHDLPGPLTWLLEQIGLLLGMNAVADGPRIVIFAMRENQPLAATWELLADPVTVSFAAGGMVLVLLRQWSAGSGGGFVRWLGPMIGLLVAVALWLPVRAGLMMGLYMHRVLRSGYDQPLDLMDQFWSWPLHLVLLAGPVLLAWRFARTSTAYPVSDELSDAGWFKPSLAGLGACLTVAVLAAAVLWEPIGHQKHGRILVDEYHSTMATWRGKDFDTTRTDRPFDTTWYGRDAAYNLASLYDYCSRFYTMSQLKRGIDKKMLSDQDVLVLKVPSGRYSDSEIKDVLEFVHKGGGLLLIGEHTSVWGSGVCLNEIARHFGFEFRDDCLFGIDSFFDEYYRPPKVPHPIIQYMGPLDFATSCSIDPGGSSGRVVIGATGLKNLQADYHAVNAYPQTENRPQMRYGAFVQVWACRYGAGRVVGFTDSTIFATFCAFEPGKSELMLGMLEWLNHRNGLGNPRTWLVAIGLVLGATTILLARMCQARWFVLVAAGVLGWSATAFAVPYVHKAYMPVPTAIKSHVRVGLDQLVCDTPLPVNGFIGGESDEFGIFERCILRLGWFPFRSKDQQLFAGKIGSDNAMTDLVVLLHPNRPISETYRQQMVAYVSNGGRLLVVESPQNAMMRLFELDPQLKGGLLAGRLADLRAPFAAHGSRLTDQAELTVTEADRQWELTDGSSRFRIRIEKARQSQIRTARDKNQVINVYGAEPQTNKLLDSFGLTVDRSIRLDGGPLESVASGLSLPSIMAETAFGVDGGGPLIRLNDHVVAATKKHGEGWVTVLGFGSRLTDLNMGVTGDEVPEPEVMKVYTFVFDLLRWLVESKG